MQHSHLDEAQTIIDAVRRIQEDPSLAAEARTDLPSTMDKLGLTGIARQSVASALGLSVGSATALSAAVASWWYF